MRITAILLSTACALQMPALQVPWKRAARSRQVEKSSTAVAGDTVLKHGLEVAMLKTVCPVWKPTVRRVHRAVEQASHRWRGRRRIIYAGPDGFRGRRERQQDITDEASQATVQAVRRGLPHDVDHAVPDLVRPLLERRRERPRHRLAIAPPRIERGREPDGRRGDHRLRRAQGRVADPIPADRRADAGRLAEALRPGALSLSPPFACFKFLYTLRH